MTPLSKTTSSECLPLHHFECHVDGLNGGALTSGKLDQEGSNGGGREARERREGVGSR